MPQDPITAAWQPDDHAVVITSDSHVGPLLKEQMREYCPKQHLEEFDEFTAAATSFAASTLGGRDQAERDEGVRSTPGRNSLTVGGWDMAERIADMNYDGIAAEIIFHGLNTGRVEPLPFGGMFGFEQGEPGMIGIGRHMYNQWLADVCTIEPERHAGLAQLPMWDVEAAIAELEWARDAGLRGINFPRPQSGLLPYNHPDWEPFWDAVEALEMPLTTHAQTGGDGSMGLAGRGNLLITILDTTGQNSRRAFPQLVFGGVFDRHPGLKLVFTEQPGNWWQPMLDEMDSLYDLLGELEGPLGRKPSEYASDHLFIGATCLAPFETATAIEDGYAGNVMWGSDYPHPEGSWQYPRYDGEPSMSKLAMRDAFAAVPIEQTAWMLGENASKLYGFDLPALRQVAERIEALTFAELHTPLDAEPEDRSTRAAMYAFRRHGAYH